MAPKYSIIIRNRAGDKIAEISDYNELRYTKKRNSPGELTFSLNDDHPVIADMAEDFYVEVWRLNKAYGLSKYKDFEGIFRGEERVTTSPNGGTFTAYCPGILDWFNDRYVLYTPGLEGKSSFSAIKDEAIASTLVQYNAGSDATDLNGRVRSGIFPYPGFPAPYITVETEAGRGQDVEYWEAHEENLLTNLQQLAKIYKFSFDLVKTMNETDRTWEYRYYPAYSAGLEQDKTASVIFSMDRGNVRKITYTYDRRKERTVFLGALKLTAAAKTYRARASYKFTESPFNNREMWISATNTDNEDELYAELDKERAEYEAKPRISVEVLQTPSTYYGLHYNIHDYVTGIYKDKNYIFAVDSVDVKVTNSDREQIDVGLVMLNEIE